MYLVILGWLTANQTQNNSTTFHTTRRTLRKTHSWHRLTHETMDPFNGTERQEHKGWWYVGKGARFSVSQGSRVHRSSWKSTSELDGRRWSVIRDCWSQLHCRKWIPSAAGRAVDVKKKSPGEAYLHLRGFVSWVRSLTQEREPLRSHWLQTPVIKHERKRPLKMRKTKRKHSTPTTAVTVYPSHSRLTSLIRFHQRLFHLSSANEHSGALDTSSDLESE